MTEAQHKDDKLTVNDVVDNAVVANANAQLTVAATQLQTAWRARVISERINCMQYAPSVLTVELPQRLQRRPRVRDFVRHAGVSKPEFGHDVGMGDSRFRTCFGSTADISLILKCFHGAVKEFWGDNDGAPASPPRSNLDRFTLGNGDIVTLLVAELGQGHGSHDLIVQLVQVGGSRASSIFQRAKPPTQKS